MGVQVQNIDYHSEGLELPVEVDGWSQLISVAQGQIIEVSEELARRLLSQTDKWAPTDAAGRKIAKELAEALEERRAGRLPRATAEEIQAADARKGTGGSPKVHEQTARPADAVEA